MITKEDFMGLKKGDVVIDCYSRRCPVLSVSPTKKCISDVPGELEVGLLIEDDLVLFGWDDCQNKIIDEEWADNLDLNHSDAYIEKKK